ncbi:TAXI family TRAP transporter solute-binding subunit [Natrialbaceae archaeon GCM10025810]|uniref:TAXI family TRAP transporter solute-binding subunit n=1 Tax=Halovalidus salilacus TaxID=3075124 RepID=UPI003607EBBA
MKYTTNRRKFLTASGLTGVAALAGCVQSQDSGNGGNSGETLSWHAGGEDGTYYPLSNEFKTIIEDNTDHSVDVQTTGASVENVGSLANGDADFALIQNDIATFAVNGEGLEDFEGEPIESLRGVATLYPETIHIVTQDDSGIETLEDLEGKRINTGDIGSGTQVDALQILEAVGLEDGDFTEENSGFGDAADQIQNGDVDAAFQVGGWPLGAIEDLAQSSGINLIEVSGDVRESVKSEAEFFADDAVPGGTYEGIDDDVETIAVQAMVATSEEIDSGVVEDVTTAIFDNVDDIETKSDFIDTDSAQDGMSIDLHEGARAYFDE